VNYLGPGVEKPPIRHPISKRWQLAEKTPTLD